VSFYHGKNTVVLVGAVNLSPYLNSIELSAEADSADTTTYGATWKPLITGILGHQLDFEGLYDPGESTVPTRFLAATGGIVTYCPIGGAAIGDPARLSSVYDTVYAESSPVGDVVSFSGTFMGDGTLGFGALLHPLAEDTNTTTGAERDDLVATTTGWTAHLHVTAVDGGSWVVTLQDAAISGSHTDLTGGSFTAATTPTSQRLVGAVGATLRRYVRYVATRTGGVGGDGITFALAYSRN